MKFYKNISFICTSMFLFLLAFSIVWQVYGISSIRVSFSQSTDASSTPADASFEDAQEDTPESIPEAKQKRVALTFDDGPHPTYTPKLLDGLAARNVKVTFFVLGESAKNHPEIIKRMYEEGHLIGNHTYSHVQLSCISEDKAILEISNTNQVINEATGYIPKYIRPPYGSLPSSLKSETNLTPVLWTVDPRDWSVLNTNSVVNHILQCAEDGDIILLHDIFETSVDAALIVIDRLSEEGFEFVTVDKLLSPSDSVKDTDASIPITN